MHRDGGSGNEALNISRSQEPLRSVDLNVVPSKDTPKMNFTDDAKLQPWQLEMLHAKQKDQMHRDGGSGNEALNISRSQEPLRSVDLNVAPSKDTLKMNFTDDGKLQPWHLEILHAKENEKAPVERGGGGDVARTLQPPKKQNLPDPGRRSTTGRRSISSTQGSDSWSDYAQYPNQQAAQAMQEQSPPAQPPPCGKRRVLFAGLS